MTADGLEQAKRSAGLARRRLDATLAQVIDRLQPGNLAGEAWDGVKDKTADVADSALGAVRRRPATVSVAVGALALFLARKPLGRAVSRYLDDEEDTESEPGVEGDESESVEGA